jgi:hypothetical protein
VVEEFSLPFKFDDNAKILGVAWVHNVYGWDEIFQLDSDVHQDGADVCKAGTIESDQEESGVQANTAENEAGVGTLTIANNQCELAEVMQDIKTPPTREEIFADSEVAKQPNLHPEYNRLSFGGWVEQQKSQLPTESENSSVSDTSFCCTHSAHDAWNTQHDTPPPPTSIPQYNVATNLGEVHLHPDPDTDLTGFTTTKLQISSHCQATLKANSYRELSALEQQSGAHILAFDPFRAQNGDVSNTALVFIQGDPFARHKAAKLLTAFSTNLEAQPPKSNFNFSFRFLGARPAREGKKIGTERSEERGGDTRLCRCGC